MHPVIHTSLGALAGFRQFIQEKTPEVVPRILEVDAEDPDDVALVSLVLAEEISAYPEVACTCVGLRTYFEGEVEPEASEPGPPMPLSANCPAEIQSTVDLARGYTRALSLDGVLKEPCRPSLGDLRDADR